MLVMQEPDAVEGLGREIDQSAHPEPNQRELLDPILQSSDHNFIIQNPAQPSDPNQEIPAADMVPPRMEATSDVQPTSHSIPATEGPQVRDVSASCD